MSAADLWVTRPIPVARPRLRLLCFPHAGGGAAQFRRWAHRLPADVELNPVRLPGRETRLAEPPFTRLSEGIDAFLASCCAYLEQPFAILGHSVGALWGFELTRRLAERGGRMPVHLFVSGRRAPRLPDPDPAIHALPENELLAELARRYGPDSTALLADPDLRAIFLPILRADFELLETYVYMEGARLPCPITALGGLEDPRATESELAAWHHETSATFALHRFPGTHFFPYSASTELMAVINTALRPRS